MVGKLFPSSAGKTAVNNTRDNIDKVIRHQKIVKARREVDAAERALNSEKRRRVELEARVEELESAERTRLYDARVEDIWAAMVLSTPPPSPTEKPTPDGTVEPTPDGTGHLDCLSFGDILLPEGSNKTSYEVGAIVIAVFPMQRGAANEAFTGAIIGQKGNQFNIGWFGRLVNLEVIPDPSYETVNLPRSLHRSFEYMVGDPSSLDAGSWCIVTE